jgi:O-antigen/teichoic acid export membrane protein
MTMATYSPITLIRKIKGAKSLAGRAAKGTLWIGMGNALEQVMRLVRNMILTRMIAPEAFGMMAIVLAVNAAFESFTQIGVKEAVVQNPNGDQREFMNSAWWLACGRALALYSAVYLAAPWVADFYGQVEITPLMRVAFLSLLFSGLMSTRAYVALKQMRFKAWTVVFFGGGILGVVTTIALGVYLKSVWALVIGFTIEGAARCFLSFVICPFLPRLHFKREYTASLFKYTRGMIGLPILTFIFMKTDVFVIGRFFAFENLGLYAMASSMAWLPFNYITNLVGQVMMPAFSECQQDTRLINDWTLKVTGLIAYLGFPLLAGVSLCGREFLSLVYGPAYAAAAGPFALIFATALLRTTTVPIASVYLALGRPQLHRLFTAIRAALIVILIYPLLKWLGINGAALAGLAAMALSYGVQVLQLRNVTGMRWTVYSAPLIKAAALSMVVILIWKLAMWTISPSGIMRLITAGSACILAYALGAWHLRRIWVARTS